MITTPPRNSTSRYPRPINPRVRRCPSAGITLLEVLLTLSLAVVLIGLVGGALKFYAIDMNVRDLEVRQTHLAAVVMQMIEDDLRATLHTEPVDTTGLEGLLATTASNVTGGAAGGPSDEDMSAAGIDSETDETEDETLATDSASVDLQTGAAVLEIPGLIGNQYQIQIDISRLPRLEEYIQVLDSDTANIDDVPSDIKTVSYFVQPAGVAGGVEDSLREVEDGTTGEEMGGLVRRSLDRAATIYSTTNSGSSILNQTGELLAPEVTGIEFAYWDGLIWQTEWSSDVYGELPLAVQVRLHMVQPTADASADPTDAENIRTFMHVIRLPMARPIEEEEEDLLSGAGV